MPVLLLPSRLRGAGPLDHSQSLGDARLAELVGDPLPVGVEANRKGLDQIIMYAQNQQIIKSKMTPEALFTENTRKS